MMEKIIAVLLIFLLIGLGMPDIFDDHFEDTREEDKIVAQERVEARGEGRDSISREFQEIAGGAEVDLRTARGDIMAIFQGRISGNATVSLTSSSGDISVRLDDGIYGAARMNINAQNGNVFFLNDRATIESYINSGHISVNAGGNVIYQ